MKKIILSLVTFTMLGSAVYAEEENTLATVEEESSVAMDTQEVSAEYTWGMNIGTEGVGVDVSFPVTPSLNIRASVNGISYSGSEVESDVEYDLSGDLLLIGALLDYYPMDNSQFHLSAGAFYNGNSIDGTGVPTSGTFEINDVSYDASEIGSLDAKFDFDTIAPYIGLGWGYRSIEPGWGFSFDLGALYQGSPNVALGATRGSGIPADNGGPNDMVFAQLQADVAAEEKALEDDVDSYSWYPIIRIGVTYTF